MTSIRSLRVILIISLLMCSYFVSLVGAEGALTVQKRWHVLRVDGRRVVDENGRQALLRGFDLWNNEIFQPWHSSRFPLTVERFSQIKNWGFNVVNILAFWSFDIEPSKTAIGVYTEPNLKKIKAVIKNAQDAGLYVVITLRVQHEADPNVTWDGWGEADMLLTPEGLRRYTDMLEMVVARFDSEPNVIGYCPWWFPFHGLPEESGQTYEARYAAYYGLITPAMIKAIRDHSNKIIFYSPYHQGLRTMSKYYPWSWDTGEYKFMSPVNDPLGNVVYIHAGHHPFSVDRPDLATAADKKYDYPDWSGDIGSIQDQLSYALAFRDKYNVPLMMGEFGLMIHKGAEADVRPIRESRLNYLDAKLTTMDNYGDYNWLYWSYSNADVEYGVMESDLSPSAVVSVLQQHPAI